MTGVRNLTVQKGNYFYSVSECLKFVHIDMVFMEILPAGHGVGT